MIDIDGVLYRLCLSGLTLLSQSLAGLEIHEDGGRLMNKFASQLQVQVNGVSFAMDPWAFLPTVAVTQHGSNTLAVSGSTGGEAFQAALRDLCARAGITYTARPITEEERIEIERKQTLGSVLEDIWQLVRNELTVEELNAKKEISGLS